jgi:hypothetical protein
MTKRFIVSSFFGSWSPSKLKSAEDPASCSIINNVTNLIPILVFIRDQIKISPNTGVVVKNVKIKSFFLSFFLYIFSSYYHPISLRNYTIRLNNWTLRTNSPLVTTEASLEHTWINSYPTMDKISLHVTNPNYNSQATQTPSVQYTLIYIYTHLHTYTLFTFHFYILHHTCSLN